MTQFDLPAICNACGLIFQAGIRLGLGVQFISAGSSSQCPRCYSVATIPSGSMLVLQNAIRLFSGPDFTKETLEAFGLIVEDLRAGKVTLPKAVARAEKLGPSFGKEFREWVSLGANIVIAMGTVAAAVIGYLALDRSNRTLEDVAVEAFEQTYVEPQLDVRPKLTWQNHLSRPEAAHSDFVPSTSNGLNRKHRRAAAAKKKNKK